MYKSLQDKLFLLDSAIKMHDGNAITAVSIIGINLGFWETAHLPLPLANIIKWEVSLNVGLGEG